MPSYRRYDLNRVWQVYRATVLPTGEKYIGSCDCPVQHRMAEHIGASWDIYHRAYGLPFQQRIRQFGVDQISIAIVAEITGPNRTKQMLHAVEQHFLDRENSAPINKNKAFRGNVIATLCDGIDAQAIHILDPEDVMTETLRWYNDQRFRPENLRHACH
jgi:hypothetical protein